MITQPSSSVGLAALLLAVVSACGGKGAPDASGPATPAAPAAQDARGATTAATAPAATPETSVAATTPPATPPAPPHAAGDGEWLVWLRGTGANGFPTYRTLWIKEVASGLEEVASRAEAVVAAGEHLYAVRESWTLIDEFVCPEDGEFDHYPKAGQKPDATTTLPKVVLADMLGGEGRPLVGELRQPGLVNPRGYVGSIDADWELRGSANGILLLREVSASYDCGAHGDSAVRFSPIDLTKAAPVDEAARASQMAAVKAKIPELFDAAEAELTKREADAEHGELFAWAIAAKAGKVQVVYQVARGTSWAGTDSEAGGYTMSEFVAADAFVPELGLGEIPAAVKALVARDGFEGYLGWSSVRGLAYDQALAAFKDQATLPTAVRPGRVAVGVAAEGAAKLTDEGRKATKAKDYVAAIAAFDAAIAADAKASRAYSGRGYAKLLSKDLEGAKTDFEKALELASDPRFQGAVWFNLGLVAEAQKDAAGAKAAFQKVLTFGPSQAAQKKLGALK